MTFDIIKTSAADKRRTIKYMDMAGSTAAKWYVSVRTGKPIKREWGEVCALFHSEVSEALEAHRKNLMDDKLPNRKGITVELADLCIRLFDMAHHHGLPLEHYVSYEKPIEPHKNIPTALAEIHMEISAIKALGPSYSIRRIGFAIMRAFGIANALGENLHSAIVQKDKFNANREDHKPAARRAKNGKRF